jgi:hypothetical protein
LYSLETIVAQKEENLLQQLEETFDLAA